MSNSNTVDSITVNDTQRILTSGCWGWCRNPHLLAEILMVISWTIPAGIRHSSSMDLYILYNWYVNI